MKGLIVLVAIVLAIIAFLTIARRGRRMRVAEATQRTATEPTDAQRSMVADLGEFLERSPLGVTDIGDESLLPHAKEKLLRALLTARRATKEAKMAGSLHAAALFLAQYQPGVGPKVLRQANLPDPETLRKTMDMQALAKMVLEGGEPGRWAEFNKLVEADIRRINEMMAAA